MSPGKGTLQVGFAVENRPEAPQTADSLKRYLVDRKSKPWVQQLADFHFLLYLSGFLDMKVCCAEHSHLRQIFPMCVKCHCVYICVDTSPCELLSQM